MEIITGIVQRMMEPVMKSIGEILERNNQAMERIAATQQMMSTRISDLEKQVRLKTPMSKSQENHINSAIREKARELLEERGCAGDRKAVTKLGGMIRKSILERYGVGSLREAPAYDYETALEQVKYWDDIHALRAIAREAKEREEKNLAVSEPATGGHGKREEACATDLAGEPGVPPVFEKGGRSLDDEVRQIVADIANERGISQKDALALFRDRFNARWSEDE
ncbi:MAG: ORF6C domain-containing protein [Clostridia bacterium]|nr:ORF6C domain-containing protein [Clostridia bacterium]